MPAHVYVNAVKPASEADYKVTAVPYPFTSMAQYEASMALPIGPEWNAELAFTDLRRPEVEVERGVYLQPLKYVAPVDKKTKSEKVQAKSKKRAKNL